MTVRVGSKYQHLISNQSCQCCDPRLLLMNGDPIANIKLIEDPSKNFVVITKDGNIQKNILG